MTDMEEELWKFLDETMLGFASGFGFGFGFGFGLETGESAKARKITPETVQRWLQQRKTLGGYLCSVRDMRELEPVDCAELAGVGEERWLAWEAGEEVPSTQELETIIERFEFGEQTGKALYRLRGEALKRKGPQ